MSPLRSGADNSTASCQSSYLFYALAAIRLRVLTDCFLRIGRQVVIRRNSQSYLDLVAESATRKLRGG